VPDHVAEAERVTNLELFFDLVFVFTITQLTVVLTEHPDGGGLVRVVLMLAVIWWMYGGYAWLTNAVPARSLHRRLLLLGGMAGFFVVALAIPGAFDGNGVAFGLAYLAVTAIHAGLFTRASEESAARAILRIAPLNGVSALLILAGGIAGGTAQYVLWALALVLQHVTPRLVGLRGFVISPGHFVERHGLVVIVAIGESVIAVGIGVSGAGHDLDASLVGVALLGLALSACLWWAYFGADDGGAERALAAAPVERRPALALVAFFYWHLLLLLGIIAAASSLHEATAHPGGALHFRPALALSGGVAVFLLGDVLFRRTLGLGSVRWRALAAALALLAVPLGTEVSATAELFGLVVVVAACLAAERRGGQPKVNA